MHGIATFDTGQCFPRVMHHSPLSLPSRNVLSDGVYGVVVLAVWLKSVGIYLKCYLFSEFDAWTFVRYSSPTTHSTLPLRPDALEGCPFSWSAMCLVPLEMISCPIARGTVGVDAPQLWTPTPRMRNSARSLWWLLKLTEGNIFARWCQNPMLHGQRNGFCSASCTGQLSWHGWETFCQLLWVLSLCSLPLVLASPFLVVFYEAANHPDWDFMLCCTVAPVISLTKASFTKSFI